MSKDDIAGELLAATEQLAALLERETDCLRAGSIGELRSLHEDKAKLTAAYEAHLNGIRAAGPSTLDAVTREAMVQAGQRLRQAASRNARAIDAARSVTTQLIGAVTKAAAAEQSRAQGYGAALFPSAKRPAALSLTLDQRL